MAFRKISLLFLLVAVFTLNAVAQTPAAPAKNADSPLAPVAWLAGGTWVTDIKNPQDDSVTHVENHI
ncbi:MAG: hypothetical protein WBS19_20675, partial [Candidatus Korobacteraceae bacterium]